MIVPEAHVYDYLWNNSGSYNFISGPLADITLLTGLAVFLKKHNCHVQHCYRLSWQEHPDHGHPVCKHHFPNERMPDLSLSAHKNPRKRRHPG